MKISIGVFRLATLFCLLNFLSGCAAQKGHANAKTENKINLVLKTARSYTGTPYVWGGTNRNGMDCSGLLLNSYKSIGIRLPRTSAQQCKMGKVVRSKDLRPGDLVFFATGRRKGKVTHAGLVTEVKDGNVKFIHASTKMGVVESSLNTNYYKKRFVQARRIL